MADKLGIKSKTKSKWVCQECSYESSGFLGKCTQCGSWGSFKEVSASKNSITDAPKHSLFVSAESQVKKLSDISEAKIERMQTKSEEFNRVLGGGIVPGSLTLLGGHPGVGKSTLLLQVASSFARQKLNVMYISAEESSEQLKLRASRLNLGDSKFLVYTENNLEKIIKEIEREEIDLVIVDSIQAIYLPELNSVPGSMTQIRECCGNLMRLAKNTNLSVMVVGHINKEGDIAGPKILEHMVDTVLQFEGEKDSNFRILRSIKNRFGSTDELALFNMTERGLIDLTNPSELFLEQRSGGIITATKDGKRSLLVEIQSLALASDNFNPRRLANGIEFNRLHQIIAVLEKNLSLGLNKADIYINVVAGLNIKEPAADLAIALAIYQSIREEAAEKFRDAIVLGEIGLNGEVRSVSNIDTRLKEAEKLGFRKAIIPENNFKKLKKGNYSIELIPVQNLSKIFKS